ncbi:MAG: transglutaminase family protein [Candidatus Dojkabacteria bacterium]
MKILKTIAIVAISILFSTLFLQKLTYAASEDFLIESFTRINYKTGDDFVKVENEYKRSVKNSKYYFPASSEKLFHIPDIQGEDEKKITEERVFKKKSLTVTDEKGSKVKYTLDEKASGEGIYIVIPNYKQTTSSSPYELVITYNTHDYIKKVDNSIVLVGTSLPKDTQFSITEKASNTTTVYNYYLSIVTDKDIPSLAKAYPEFTKETKGEKTSYKFAQTDRLEASPYLEFGTSVTYKFELNYTTPKTDNFIPEKYSTILKALSSNIYEISLPREFAETNQKVYFDNVSPTPIDIYKDEEGNIIALFEVPANQESIISINGYVMLEQDSFADMTHPLDITLEKYFNDIKSVDFTKKYLASTKYWESNDPYIVDIANKLSKDLTSLEQLVKADYKYINDTLDYDESKANSDNERIGAVNALKGGGSVCMEYADSMIAILKAQGIPSRAALGYANLKGIKGENQIRHQWVQIWIPDYGWFSIDPTFESENIKIGQLLDRVLWETFNGDSLSNIRIFSADNITQLTTDGFDLKIFGASEQVDLENLKEYVDLIPDKNYQEKGIPENNGYSISTWLNTFLKATVFGKALIVTIPILTTLTVLIVIISGISFLIKKAKKKKDGLRQI